MKELRAEVAESCEGLREEMAGVDEIQFRVRIDMRYVGQSHELSVGVDMENLGDAAEAFHGVHRQRYGHAEPDAEVELVTLRVEAEGPEPLGIVPELSSRRSEEGGLSTEDPVISRKEFRRGDVLTGPALIVEDFHTVCLPEGWHLEADRVGNLIGTRVEDAE